jgi:hypothetical protein
MLTEDLKFLVEQYVVKENRNNSLGKAEVLIQWKDFQQLENQWIYSMPISKFQLEDKLKLGGGGGVVLLAELIPSPLIVIQNID